MTIAVLVTDEQQHLLDRGKISISAYIEKNYGY
eukprot:SAG25_NODE_655_length_6126_cov_12.125270_2_plen_33_part_00